MKESTRFLGIDDSQVEKEKIIGVLYRGTEFIESIETVESEKDGGSGTEKILKLYNKFKPHIEALMIDGISFTGFNVVDIERITSETGKPVLAVTDNRPDREKFSEAMEKADVSFDMDKLPEIHKVEFSTGEAFVQFSGCGKEEAKEIIEASTIQGNIPECVRVADIIGEEV
jgi:endonuclease V-like protein UPF0215 family